MQLSKNSSCFLRDSGSDDFKLEINEANDAGELCKIEFSTKTDLNKPGICRVKSLSDVLTSMFKTEVNAEYCMDAAQEDIISISINFATINCYSAPLPGCCHQRIDADCCAMLRIFCN